MIKISSGIKEISVKINTFGGGEEHVNIEPGLHYALSESVPIKILSRIQSSSDLMRTVLVIDALKREYQGYKIELTIPYLPYARQDRVCAKENA